MGRRRKELVEAGLCQKELHAWVDGQRACQECKHAHDAARERTTRRSEYRAAGLCYSGRHEKVPGEKTCKACAEESQRKWLADPANRKKMVEGKRAYRSRTTPEQRAAEIARAAEWARRNPEKVLEHKRRYRERNRESLKESNRQYAAANREKLREKDRRYREANADKERARQQRWNAANLDRLAERARARRALKLANGVAKIRSVDLDRLLKSSCAHAHLDKCSGPIEVDHIVPLSRGGRHAVGNLQPLCRHHNRSKADRLEVEVKAGRPGLARARRKVAA